MVRFVDRGTCPPVYSLCHIVSNTWSVGAQILLNCQHIFDATFITTIHKDRWMTVHTSSLSASCSGSNLYRTTPVFSYTISYICKVSGVVHNTWSDPMGLLNFWFIAGPLVPSRSNYISSRAMCNNSKCKKTYVKSQPETQRDVQEISRSNIERPVRGHLFDYMLYRRLTSSRLVCRGELPGLDQFLERCCIFHITV